MSQAEFSAVERNGAVKETSPDIIGLIYIERSLARLRFLVPILMVVMATLYQSLAQAGVVALAVGVLGYNVLTLAVLGEGVLDKTALQRLGLVNTVLDILVASVVFVLFSGDPRSIPVALFPFVAFELGARYGNRGMALGVGLFTVVLAGRIASQVWVFDNPPRAANIIFFFVVVMLLLSVSRDLRLAETARLAATQERERIAEGFRDALAQMMARAGIEDREMTYQNVIETLRRMCATRKSGVDADVGAELGLRLAELISTRPEDIYGVTPREREILKMMATGLTYQQIADNLYVSPSTVRNHASSIMRKLKVNSRYQAVEFSREHRLI